MKPRTICSLMLIAMLAGGGCGSEADEPMGEVIVLAHYDRANSYVTPFVEAVAAVEGKNAETDAGGVQRVALDVSGKMLTLADYQSHEQVMQRLQDDAARPVAAILIMMGTHGIMPDQEEQLQQAHKAGVPVVAVLQSQIHLIDDMELLDLEELEAEEALTQAGYPAGTPLRRASAVKAVEGEAAANNDVAQFLAMLRQQLQTHI